MADREPDTHLLASDLAAIDAFSAQPDQPPELAGRAARALYDDIVWRLAHAELPAAARARVITLERMAADMIVAFVRRGLPPHYFWSDFATLAHELDAVVTRARTRATGGEGEMARKQLVALRQAVAAATFPPAVRGRLHAALMALATGLEAFDAGELSGPALHALAEAAHEAMQAALAATQPLVVGAEHARFHRLSDTALRLTPSPERRGAIASRLSALHEAWADEAPLHGPDLDALEALLAEQAADPAGYATPSATPGLANATRRLDQAANRVGVAPLPPFVAQAASEIIGHMRGVLADRAAGTLDAASFDVVFAGGLEAIESCLAFAREVSAERDVTARRVEVLTRRVAEADLPPFLAGPVEDELEQLRGLMRNLEAGRASLIDFYRDFEAAAVHIERLLSWRHSF